MFASLSPNNLSSSILIGIGGARQSGKTTLANELEAFFQSKGITCTIIHQDDFVLPENSLPQIKGAINWELPETIDWENIVATVSKLSSHSQIIIIEGLFAFHHNPFHISYTHQVYMEIDYPTFMERKQKDERWGPVADWYVQHIWKSHLKNKRVPPGAIMLDGKKDVEINLLINKMSLEA